MDLGKRLIAPIRAQMVLGSGCGLVLYLVPDREAAQKELPAGIREIGDSPKKWTLRIKDKDRQEAKGAVFTGLGLLVGPEYELHLSAGILRFLLSGGAESGARS